MSSCAEAAQVANLYARRISSRAADEVSYFLSFVAALSQSEISIQLRVPVWPRNCSDLRCWTEPAFGRCWMDFPAWGSCAQTATHVIADNSQESRRSVGVFNVIVVRSTVKLGRSILAQNRV